MKTVWKSVLKTTTHQAIRVPIGSELLTAREQHGQVCVWYRCDPDEPLEARYIAVCGTGHHSANGRYIGSAHLEGGSLVFHVFEL